MKIKQQDEQHLVIGPTLGDQLGVTFGFVFLIGWTIGVQFIPLIWMRVLFSAVGLVLIYIVLRSPIVTRIAIDKLTQTVTISDRSFFLVSRQLVIPFSAVSSVSITYKQKTGGGGGDPYGGGTTKYDTWEIFVGSHKIDQSTNKAKMLHLTSEISKFIGRELVDNSAKPESGFRRFFRNVFPPRQEHPDASVPKVSGEEAAEKRGKRIEEEAAREDAVAKWKKRIEEEREAEERNKGTGTVE